MTSNRPFIIPIFIPHAGCPHQCVFCNQVSITGVRHRTVASDQLHHQIDAFLKYKKKNRAPVQIAFFGGNFLGLPDATIKFYLEQAAEFVYQGSVDSIRFSTRPDTIDNRRLDILSEFPAATVELGVQSMDDRVLARSRRGHTAADTIQAVAQLKARGYQIGLQIMVGLPEDNATRALNTAHKICDLRPDFVRIYPTVVLENSPLAAWFKKGVYRPLSLREGVCLVKKIYLLFDRENIKVIRMGLQASEDLAEGSTVLTGPYHPAFGHLVYCEIFLDAVKKALKSTRILTDTVTVAVNPRSLSKLQGFKNSNITKLKKEFRLQRINIITDIEIDENSLKVGDNPPRSICTLADIELQG